MTCRECADKEDCCFYCKEEENRKCIYETFLRDRDKEEKK